MYGFDRDSRRAWRRRILTLGEDQVYGYDGLSQVVRDARGNLNINGTAISAVPASEENWDYDPTGNWRGYETQVAGAVTLDQHRVHDKGNRLTQIEGDPNSIILDRAGRMLQVPPDETGDWDQSLELKWDAWGRITQVKYAGDEEALGNYRYDGLTRRITREVWDDEIEEMVAHHSYFSRNWRPLEERKAAATTASMQYLWGARHRDDLVRRDRDANDDATLDETRYVMMDYFSPASIVDETGAVTERYAFSAFGVRRIVAPDWSPRSLSECAWEFGFQGQFFDAESGFLNYGYRYYSPRLGVWTRKDPIAERGGINLYSIAANSAVNGVDLFGRETFYFMSRSFENYSAAEVSVTTENLCDRNLAGVVTISLSVPYSLEAELNNARVLIDGGIGDIRTNEGNTGVSKGRTLDICPTGYVQRSIPISISDRAGPISISADGGGNNPGHSLIVELEYSCEERCGSCQLTEPLKVSITIGS